MPLQKIPVTMRDFFWDDPFFSNVWEDFDSLRNSIWKESSDKFSRFEREHRSSINDSDFKSTSLTCKYIKVKFMTFLNFSFNFLNPNYFLQLKSNYSNVLDLGHFQE